MTHRQACGSSSPRPGAPPRASNPSTAQNLGRGKEGSSPRLQRLRRPASKTVRDKTSGACHLPALPRISWLYGFTSGVSVLRHRARLYLTCPTLFQERWLYTTSPTLPPVARLYDRCRHLSSTPFSSLTPTEKDMYIHLERFACLSEKQ